MGDIDRKLVEKLDGDFHKISSKEGWEPCDITLMKDLQKLMYYIEVRDAMKDSGEYPGSQYMDSREYDRSYRGGRRSGRSYDNYDGRSMHIPMMNDNPWYYDGGYDQGSGRRYYDDMRSSGRRYYDSEKDNTMNYLHRMMETDSRPEMKSAIQTLMRELEAK